MIMDAAEPIMNAAEPDLSRVYVVGLVPQDREGIRMRAVWDACQTARVPCPDSVRDYFGAGGPDAAGHVAVPYEMRTTGHGVVVRVRLSEVPDSVRDIQFCCPE